MQKMNKLKKIYLERVLPKKSVTKNTFETYKADLKILNDFSNYRDRANEGVLLR